MTVTADNWDANNERTTKHGEKETIPLCMSYVKSTDMISINFLIKHTINVQVYSIKYTRMSEK